VCFGTNVWGKWHRAIFFYSALPDFYKYAQRSEVEDVHLGKYLLNVTGASAEF
jgi:hypothetical protein